MAMEPKERMLLEGVLGAVLIAFLVLASIMIVSAYGDSDAKVINSYNTNSFNKNSFNAYPAQKTPVTSATAYATTQPRKYAAASTYYVDKRYYKDNSVYYKVYYEKDYPEYPETKRYADKRYISYDDYGNLRTYKGVIGNNVNSYEVYVKNMEYTGGYFKTVFYFEDYSGKVDSQSQVYYVPAREEKTFAYRDVSPPPYKYRYWWYEVIPRETESKGAYYTTYYKDSDSYFPGYYSGYRSGYYYR